MKKFSADHVFSLIKKLPPEELNHLAILIADDPSLFSAVFTKHKLHKALGESIAALEPSETVRQAISSLRKMPLQKTRRPSKERLRRGRIIVQANEAGVSWKKMPSHILVNFPNWFPEYENNPPMGRRKKRLEGKLRRMASDARKAAK